MSSFTSCESEISAPTPLETFSVPNYSSVFAVSLVSTTVRLQNDPPDWPACIVRWRSYMTSSALSMLNSPNTSKEDECALWVQVATGVEGL